MENNAMTSQPPQTAQKNPVEMLQDQVTLLAHIHQTQQEQLRFLATDIYRTQQEQLQVLRSLSEQLASLQVEVSQFAQSVHRVQVEDFDMPFTSMVPFLLKRSFALGIVSIILGVIGLCIFFALITFAGPYFRF